MTFRPAFLLCLLPAALFAAAPIEFEGVQISDGGVIQVALVNTATLNFKWIPVGGKFGGYIVQACNNATTNKPEIVLVPSTSPNGPKQVLRIKDVSVGVPTGSFGTTTPSPLPATASTLLRSTDTAATTSSAAADAQAARAEALARAQAQAAATAQAQGLNFTPTPPPPATAPAP
jgi:hypothetical protein